MCKLLSLCGVRFISISSRGLVSLCNVQWTPIELQGCVLFGLGMGASTREVLSTFGARGSSLALVGLLLSSCEGLHSTYFMELVSIWGRRVFSLSPAGLHSVLLGKSTSVLAGEPLCNFGQWLLFLLQLSASVKLQQGIPGAS